MLKHLRTNTICAANLAVVKLSFCERDGQTLGFVGMISCRRLQQVPPHDKVTHVVACLPESSQ